MYLCGQIFDAIIINYLILLISITHQITKYLNLILNKLIGQHQN